MVKVVQKVRMTKLYTNNFGLGAVNQSFAANPLQFVIFYSSCSNNWLAVITPKTFISIPECFKAMATHVLHVLKR